MTKKNVEIEDDGSEKGLAAQGNPDQSITEATIQARIDAALEAAAGAAEVEAQARIGAAVAEALANQEPVDVPAPPLAEGKRIRIILEENDGIPPTGQFFGANGRSYLIRPGEEVDVPMEVIGCLDDAVMETPITDMNGNLEGFRKRLRFPYRVISRDL